MYEEEEFTDLNPLIDRFEDMLKKRELWFFDVQEFEAISDYYYQTGRLRKAIKAAEIASQQHPYCSTFVARKAQYFTANDNLKKARQELNKLESMEPESFDLFMAQATLFSKEGKHHKAIGLYKQAMKKADFPEDVWPIIAMEYQMSGNYEMAFKYLKITLEDNPDDEIAIYNIALCFDLLDKSGEGIKYFKKFIDKNPYCEIAWYHLGILSAKEKLYNDALQAIDYAILIDEFFTAAYYEKARLLERTYRYREAADTYLQSLEYEGPTGFSYYKIGMCYLNMHKDEKALTYFTKAIQEDPDLDEAYYELSLLKDEDKSGPESIYYINKALELNPDSADYLFVSAEIHRRAGLLNEAEIIYQKIIELGHIDPDVFIEYAELLFDLCEFEEGMDVLYQGVQLNEGSADMNYRMAGYLYILRESDEADIYFKKALELDADRKNHFFNLFPKLKSHSAIQRILGKRKGHQTKF